MTRKPWVNACGFCVAKNRGLFMGNLKIEYLQISDLIPYANNPRINDGAVE